MTVKRLPPRASRALAALSVLAAVCAASTTLGQSVPPPAPPPAQGLVSAGVKTSAYTTTQADNRFGPTISITQPAPGVPIWSGCGNFFSVNMPPYGLSQRTVSINCQQSDPVSGMQRPMLDAHCISSWQGRGFLNGGTFLGQSNFNYIGVRAPGVTRKVIWIALRAYGSPNVHNAADEVMRVDFGGRFVRVRAVSATASSPSHYVVEGLFNDPGAGGQVTTISSGPMVNCMVIYQFPESENFAPGTVAVRHNSAMNIANFTPGAAGQMFFGSDAWLMWDNAPRAERDVRVGPIVPRPVSRPTTNDPGTGAPNASN